MQTIKIFQYASVNVKKPKIGSQNDYSKNCAHPRVAGTSMHSNLPTTTPVVLPNGDVDERHVVAPAGMIQQRLSAQATYRQVLSEITCDPGTG